MENYKFNKETVEFLKSKQSFLECEFLETNIIGRSIISEDIASIKIFYHKMINNLCTGETSLFLEELKKLSFLYIKLEIPYIALLNELNHMQNIFMELFLNYDKKEEIITLYKIYLSSQNEIAKIYLDIYIKNLKKICNKRLSSLDDMVEQFVVDHYSKHLQWLIDLASSISSKTLKRFPQTDKSLCQFGKWLGSDAKNIIKNNSKLKEIDRIHSQLHYMASQIRQIISSKDENYDYDILLTYLEKCELLSLSIGTELALIDNTIVNQKATKDSLTGALGRQVLEQIFQNQYEIASATDTKFTIAICDLDYFKKINDNYGHIAGDKMLQGFVETVKNKIRNSDIIIRYGGEEFIIILPAIELNSAFNVLEKVRLDFENFVLNFENKNISTTVSIGMYEVKTEQTYCKDILEDAVNYADHKLYQAKNDGRNRIKK